MLHRAAALLLALCSACQCSAPPPPAPAPVVIGTPSTLGIGAATFLSDGSLKVTLRGPQAAPTVRVQLGHQEQPISQTATADGDGWAVTLTGLGDSGQALLVVEVAGSTTEPGLLFVELGWATMTSEATELTSADGVFSIEPTSAQLGAGTRVAIAHVPGAAGGALAGPYQVSSAAPLTVRARFSPAAPRQDGALEPPGLTEEAHVVRVPLEGGALADVPLVRHSALGRVSFNAELPGTFALIRGAP